MLRLTLLACVPSGTLPGRGGHLQERVKPLEDQARSEWCFSLAVDLKNQI